MQFIRVFESFITYVLTLFLNVFVDRKPAPENSPDIRRGTMKINYLTMRNVLNQLALDSWLLRSVGV